MSKKKVKQKMDNPNTKEYWDERAKKYGKGDEPENPLFHPIKDGLS